MLRPISWKVLPQRSSLCPSSCDPTSLSSPGILSCSGLPSAGPIPPPHPQHPQPLCWPNTPRPHHERLDSHIALAALQNIAPWSFCLKPGCPLRTPVFPRTLLRSLFWVTSHLGCPVFWQTPACRVDLVPCLGCRRQALLTVGEFSVFPCVSHPAEQGLLKDSDGVLLTMCPVPSRVAGHVLGVSGGVWSTLV